jgi:hypothetical protein
MIMAVGQFTYTGAVTSCIVTGTLQEVELPFKSVTVTVIVVLLPFAWPNVRPAAGDWLTEAIPQASLPDTPPVTDGTVASHPDTVTGAGQLNTGGVASRTVTVATHTEVLPAPSVTVRVKSLLPTCAQPYVCETGDN